MRVLIVSQSKPLLRLLKDHLSEREAKVVVATSPSGMMESMRAVSFDAIFYDSELGPVRESSIRGVQRGVRFALVADHADEEMSSWSDLLVLKPLDGGALNEACDALMLQPHHKAIRIHSR